PAAASASPTPARRTWYFSPSAPRAFARTPTFPSTEPRLAGRPRRAYACLASALANTQNPLRDDDHEMDDLAVRRRRTGLWPRRGGRRQLPHRPGPLPGGGGGGCNDCHTPGFAEASGNVPGVDQLLGSDIGYSGPWGCPTRAICASPRR